MSGHSKWNNIKNRKGTQDKKKSREFFLVSKMIRSAVQRSHDGNPETNPGLRLALEKARAVNMPKENVQRAINRALGKGEGGQAIQEVMYEGYGPGGVAIYAVAVTDNVQRTAGNIRFIFSRNGGSLGGPGSAAFLFTRGDEGFVPTMTLPLDAAARQELNALVEALEEDEDIEEVYTNAEPEGSA